MQFHQLELFCTVVERGSFARAADVLFITSSALRIQVKRLETALGVTLLRRAPGGMTPTEPGRELYAAGRAMLELRETATRRLAELRQGTAGTVTVGVFHTAPLYFLTEVLREFGPAFPAVNVITRVVEQDRLFDALVRGTVDLGLDWGPVTRGGILADPLVEESWVVVAAPTHPLAGRGEISREQLAAAEFIGLQVGPRVIEFADDAMQDAGLRRNVVMRLPFQDAVKRLLETGRYVSMMARIAAEREIASGQLIALDVAGFNLKYPLLLLRAESGPRSPAVTTFEHYLRQHPRTRAQPTAH